MGRVLRVGKKSKPTDGNPWAYSLSQGNGGDQRPARLLTGRAGDGQFIVEVADARLQAQEPFDERTLFGRGHLAAKRDDVAVHGDGDFVPARERALNNV